MYKCLCCDNETLPVGPVCWWENDVFLKSPDEPSDENHGMTQKDLAEWLNVSDKTVSCWERDDGAPNLAAIPAIAEIFGVTCDELLRGERKSPTERAEVTEETETTPKAEKQRQRLLKSTLPC